MIPAWQSPVQKNRQKRKGKSMNKTENVGKSWRLQDVLLMAMLGVLFALVYLGVFYLGLALQTALTPVGFGPFAFELVYGIWFLAATIAAFIIQKPGVAFTTEFLAALIELLMGNSGGMLVVITGVIQGIGCELGFALFRYRVWDRRSLLCSALCAALITMLQTLYLNGYANLQGGIIAAMAALRILSSLLFCGFFAEILGKGLAKTGVLRSYPLGRQYGPNLVAEDDAL